MILVRICALPIASEYEKDNPLILIQKTGTTFLYRFSSREIVYG